MTSRDVAPIVETLRGAEEALRDLAYDCLAEAAASADPEGASARAAQDVEKRVLRARRAVARAIAALEGPGESQPFDEA